MSLRIKDVEVKDPRLTVYPRDIRFLAVDGDGTYAINQQKSLPEIGKELGSNNYTCFTLGTDNNNKAVNKALVEAKPYADWKPMVLWKNHFKLIMRHLPSLDDTVGGFGRSPKTCIESAPRFYPTIVQGVSAAKFHDLRCGSKMSVRIEPFNWGSHLPVKAIQNVESMSQGLLRGTRIGLTTIPSEMMSLEVYKEWFPTLLDSNMFGVDATVISDEGLYPSGGRKETDERILKGIVGTCMAFVYDPSQPGYRDIWKILSRESKLIGVHAAESDIIAWRRFRTLWRVAVDEEVSVIQVRRLIQKVVNDENTRLIDADVDEGSPRILVVMAKVSKEIFNQAVDESFLPAKVITIFVPTNSYKISAVLFYPLKERVPSIERHFDLKDYYPEEAYSLPRAITENSLEQTKGVIEKASRIVCVSPEILLNCGRERHNGHF